MGWRWQNPHCFHHLTHRTHLEALRLHTFARIILLYPGGRIWQLFPSCRKTQWTLPGLVHENLTRVKFGSQFQLHLDVSFYRAFESNLACETARLATLAPTQRVKKNSIAYLERRPMAIKITRIPGHRGTGARGTIRQGCVHDRLPGGPPCSHTGEGPTGVKSLFQQPSVATVCTHNCIISRVRIDTWDYRYNAASHLGVTSPVHFGLADECCVCVPPAMA